MILKLIKTFATLFAVFVIVSYNKRLSSLAVKITKKHGLRLLLCVSIVVILSYVLLVSWYSVTRQFADHVEPNIASVSWLVTTGKDIYHGLNSADRYSLLYGPMLYIINGFALRMLGPSLFSAKISGVLAALLSVLCLFFTFQGITDSQTAFIYSAITILTLAMFDSISFWGRGDPLILLCVALGLLSVTRGSTLVATGSIAIALGISLNLKIHSLIYFLPILIMLYLRSDIKHLFASIAASITLALVPFLVTSNISMVNYTQWLYQAGEHGLSLDMLKETLDFLIFFSVPILALGCLWCSHTYRFMKANKLYLSTLLISIAILLITASKPGAGRHHLIPLIPSLVYLAAILIAEIRKSSNQAMIRRIVPQIMIIIISAFLVTTFKTAIGRQKSMVKNLLKKSIWRIDEDIQRILVSYPNTSIGMGYGGNYEVTYYRPALVFAGNRLLVDAAALMDMQESGLDIPSQTLEALDSCQTQIWLIPKGGRPFEINNFYPPHNQLFSNRFRDVFLKRYKLREQTTYFDVWICKGM